MTNPQQQPTWEPDIPKGAIIFDNMRCTDHQSRQISTCLHALRDAIRQVESQARNEGIILGWNEAKKGHSFQDVFGGTEKNVDATKVALLIAAQNANIEQAKTVAVAEARADQREQDAEEVRDACEHNLGEHSHSMQTSLCESCDQLADSIESPKETPE